MKASLSIPALVLAVTALRLVVSAVVGLGDAEAYYWTWSRQLDLGYLDHGPVVAWLIRLGTTVAGPTPLGVRWPFVLLSGLVLWLVAALGQRLAGSAGKAAAHRAALWSALLLLAVPAYQVAGAAANPDVPLMCLVVSVLWLLLHRSLDQSGLPAVGRLGLAGLLVGLAISTKLIGALLLLPLAVAARSRHAPRLPAALAAILGAVLGAAPFVYWNATHGWATLAYHLVHRHNAQPVGPSWPNLAKLVGGQLGYVTPWVLLALGAGLVHLLRPQRRAVDTARAAAAAAASHASPWPAPWTAALTSCALGLLGAGYGLILVVPNAEPHWPAAGYLPLIPVAGVLLDGWRRQRRWVRHLCWVGGALSMLIWIGVHVHVLTDLGVRLTPAAHYHGRWDLSNELRGWDAVARAVTEDLAAWTRLRPGRRIWVAGAHYTTCSQLAFAAQGRFRVVCPSPRLDQFDMTGQGDGSQLRQLDLLYVEDDRFPFPVESMLRCGSTPSLAARPRNPLAILTQSRLDPAGSVMDPYGSPGDPRGSTVRRTERGTVVTLVRAQREVRRWRLQFCSDFKGLQARTWPPALP